MTRATRQIVISSVARNLLLISMLSLVASGVASAQVPTGTPPFGSFGGGPDVINLANLNAHLTIPVLHKPGRGLNFNFDLNYDSSVWIPVTSSGTTSWQPAAAWGFSSSAFKIGNITNSVTISQTTCLDQHHLPHTETTWHYSNWAYTDAFGTRHQFGGTSTHEDGCHIGSGGFTETALDGSGFSLTTNGAGGSLYGTDGSLISAPINNPAASGSATDRNGNQISYTSATGVFTDTLGTKALTVAGSAPNPVTYSYLAPSGAPATFTVRFTALTVQTKFGCTSPAIGEYGPTSQNLVSEIDLPDGAKYSFTYEGTPGVSGNVTGRLASVTFPTGGSISYAYTGGNNGINCSDGTTPILTRTVTPGGAWTYARTGTAPATTTTITDPLSNDSVIQFQGIYETQRDVYQGSPPGTLLGTTYTCYNAATSPCNSTAITLPINSRAVITSLPSAGSTTLQSKSVALYNGVGGSTEIDTYAFGSGAPPTTPSSKTLITYASLGNITAFSQTVTVQDGSGQTLSKVNYNYDETTPVAAPTGTSQLTSVSGSRGNLTSVQRCSVIPSCTSNLKTTMTYDTAGQLQTLKDPKLNQTNFSYTDNFYTDNSSDPVKPKAYSSTAPTDAFVTKVTPPLIGAANFGYYIYSGQLATSTDQNSNDAYTHFQDSLSRLTSAFGPLSPGGNRPWTLNVYASTDTQADTYLGITDTTASASCSSCRHDQALLDGLGRPITQSLINDPEGATSVTTAYDQLGRVKNSSHPARSTSSTTDGIETPTYDAVGRTIKMTHPDGTFSQTLYGAAVSGTGVRTTQLCSSATYGLGFPVLAIDEAGKKREVWTDGLGRTIEVDEPDSTGALNSATCSTFDSLGNLLTIVHGSQTHTYAYDTLSRVNSVTIPELANSSGSNCAVTYTYDNNSNVLTQTAPAPNQTTCTSTVTITLSYDALNRVTGKTYSDGSPAVKYGYDGVALTGCTTTPPTLADSNPKGQRTSMCDSSGATSWAHDATGKILTEMRNILGVTKTISYVYNLDGSIATTTYPSGKVVTYTVSNAQRLTAANDVANSVQFAITASYAPPGVLQGMISGKISGGFGGVTESHTYNKSLEYTSTQATSSAGTALNLTLNYNLPGGDNSTVTSITNNVDNGRTQSFAYDPLNRILSASSGATSGVDCWGQNFGPDGQSADDSVANMTKINSGTQTAPPCPFGLFNATVDANNHINTDSTYAYDALGNMTKDGSGTGYLYTFDDEGRLTLASGMTGGPYCYVYDGNGLRVAKKSGATTCASGTVTKLYWRSIAGDSLAETDSSGSTTNAAYNEYVFFTGRRIASRNGTGGVFYYFADALGSTRTITDASGKLCYDADFSPYGQEMSHSGTLQTTACPPNYKFTGYERDPETGLDYAFARYYSSRLGRFLSTDPLAGASGPQSLNAYAYTNNNPTNLIDPLGLKCVQLDDKSWADDGTDPPCDKPGVFDPQEFSFNGDDEPWWCGGFGCGSVWQRYWLNLSRRHTHFGSNSGGGGGNSSASQTKLPKCSSLGAVGVLAAGISDASQLTGTGYILGLNGNALKAVGLGVDSAGSVALVSDPSGNVGIAKTLSVTPSVGKRSYAGGLIIGASTFSSLSGYSSYSKVNFTATGGAGLATGFTMTSNSSGISTTAFVGFSGPGVSAGGNGLSVTNNVQAFCKQ